MAGLLVPLVMLPRYSCYSGATVFTTIPIDVSAYDSIILSAWRGDLVGTAFKLTVQESTDQSTATSWTTVSGISADSDPGEETEAKYTGTLTKRWLRLKLELTGTTPVVTCWALGFLQQRTA